jgi:hypothetical protein
VLIVLVKQVNKLPVNLSHDLEALFAFGDERLGKGTLVAEHAADQEGNLVWDDLACLHGEFLA